ncbi:CBS domain-containing protein [Knoellia sp. LjRoot47]|uniref:CBS domain-containing protein n=1 Tax=Knoellia sp. LjRoot47 TaxID=3342330 RepID=UPI003ED0CFD0
MLVSEVMTSPALSLPVSATLDDVVELLGGSGISAIPVVDEAGRCVGIVSEADVLRQPLPRDPRAHLWTTSATSGPSPSLDEVMTKDPTCVAPTDDCADVAALFARSGFKSMPVVDDDRLVGVVSRSDILRAMSVSSASLADAVSKAVTSVGMPERTVTVQSGHVVVTPTGDGLDDAVVAVVSTVPGVRSVRLG